MVRATSKTYNQEKLRILVNLGGVDKDNLTGTVLETLSNSPQEKHLSVTVVMGLTLLERICSATSKETSL